MQELRKAAPAQLCHAQQRVAADLQSGQESHFAQPNNLHLTKWPPVFAPAQGLLDALSQTLTHSIARVALHGAPMNQNSTSGLTVIDRHVRGVILPRSAGLDKACNVT